MRSLLLATLLSLPAAAQNPLERLVQQQSHYWYTVESVSTETQWLEAADDFDVVADVHRVRTLGHACWSCLPGDLLSARLAFYEWTPDGPGALEREYVFQDGDPGLGYSEGPALIDFTLAEPFPATGRHFVSVQVEVFGFWSWRAANYGEPVGAPVYSRTEPGGEWQRHVIVYPPGPADGDLAFELYGVDDTPPDGGVDPVGPWSVVATPEPDNGFSVFLRDTVAFAPDDVWAVGGYTEIYAAPFLIKSLSWIQRWDGQAWNRVPSPNPEPYTNGGSLTLYSVDGVGPDDVWAAGGYHVQNPNGGSLGSQIFVVHWDGNEWSQVPTPTSVVGSGPFVHDVLALAEDDVWFVGQWLGFEDSALGEQRSLAMHWDGSSFELTDTPFFDNSGGYGGGHSIEEIDGVAPDDLWAVGGAHGPAFSPHSYIAHWDGSEWTHVPGPTPGLYNRLFAVEALASDDVWASGVYRAESGATVSLYLHWDGSSWTQVEAPGGGNALLHRPEAGDLISTGGIYGGEGVFRWDGAQWSHVMDFPTSTNPSIVALGLVPGTSSVWGVGRQNGPDVGGLTVRLDPAELTAHVEILEPCGAAAPPQSLLASPAPIVGKSLSVAAHDPAVVASLTPGSPAALVYGAPPAGGCGLVLPGLGPDLADGELLASGPLSFLGAESWGGPESPAVFDLAVPDQAALIGHTIAVQAAFVDAADGDVVLSRALLLTFGH